MIDPAQGLVVLAGLALALAAGFDLARFTIPDIFAAIILVTGVAHAMIADAPLALHLAAPVMTLAAGLVVFRAGVMGGGDVKLLVAVAGWTGLGGLASVMLAISVAGGMLAVVLVLARGAAKMFASTPMPRVLQGGAPLPYAVAIAVGSLGSAVLAAA